MRDRLSRRIVNNNESILKIDCALSEAPRFEHHKHQDEYLIPSFLIADSVDHVEMAHTYPMMGQIPDDPSMFLAVPTMLDPSLAPEGQHTLWIEFFAPYQIKAAQGTGLHPTFRTQNCHNRFLLK